MSSRIILTGLPKKQFFFNNIVHKNEYYMLLDFHENWYLRVFLIHQVFVISLLLIFEWKSK